MRYTIQLLPYGAFYTDETARWLETQAANGLRLHRVLGDSSLAIFEKTDPQTVRFFAECTHRGEPAAAWSFVGSTGGMTLYRCEDAGAAAPTIDQEAELSTLRKAFSWNLAFLVVLSLLIALCIFRFIQEGFWLNLASSGGLIDTCLIAELIWLAALALGRAMAAKHAVGRLASPTTATASPRQVNRHRTAMTVTAWMILLACAVGLCGIVSMLPLSYDKPLPVPTAQELIGEFRSDSLRDTSSVSCGYTLIAPTALTYHQRGDYIGQDGAHIEFRLDTTYYRTWSPWLAKRLVHDLIDHEYICCYTEPLEITIDGIAYTAVYDGINTYFQNGNTVMVVDFSTWDHTNEAFDPIPAEEWILTAAEYLK